jgi:hypothetical protein
LHGIPLGNFQSDLARFSGLKVVEIVELLACLLNLQRLASSVVLERLQRTLELPAFSQSRRKFSVHLAEVIISLFKLLSGGLIFNMQY